ncbi:hypothetical protein AXF42_Ash006583 [Apostasia shenzhenica]|uniref:Uncharacterized protein n=1 Tax=Apostasia shenzhenica TaxID=1088818 RepID=A0A2I0AZI5_9ASPA|nr:hypothetical protein AXF42_Ash006583 [Apostasia shenzhenica]
MLSPLLLMFLESNREAERGNIGVTNPRPRRYTWPRIVVEMRGKSDKPSSTRGVLSLGRSLRSMRRAAVKKGWVRPTGPKPAPPIGVYPDNYCEFHGNYGHRLHKCRGLRALLDNW